MTSDRPPPGYDVCYVSREEYHEAERRRSRRSARRVLVLVGIMGAIVLFLIGMVVGSYL